MQLLDLSLPTAAENLALDEAILDSVDESPTAPEMLRLWECPQMAVVLGRSCKVAEEVNVAACDAAGVPILRRTSGGGTVVIGPGCLQFSLRLSYEQRPQLRMLDEAHRFVLTTVARAVNDGLGSELVELRGTSDLAIGEQKVSGNSVRCKRNFLLYHGTLLYRFDLGLIPKLLRAPPRQPEYRAGREHAEFVRNLPVDRDMLKMNLRRVWNAIEPATATPTALANELLETRYRSDAWNFER